MIQRKIAAVSTAAAVCMTLSMASPMQANASPNKSQVSGSDKVAGKASSPNGYWVKAGPHKGSTHPQFFGAIVVGGRLVWCSDPYLPFRSAILHASNGALPHLQKGKSVLLKTILNQYSASANTRVEKAALAYNAYYWSTSKAFQADKAWYTNRLPNSVIKLAKHERAWAVRNHGPFHLSMLDFGNKPKYVGGSTHVSARLTSASGHGLPGHKPKVTCKGAKVSQVTDTNRKGHFGFLASRLKLGRVSCTATIGGLPSWTKSLTASPAGFQHVSTGHFKASVHSRGHFKVHGAQRPKMKVICGPNCDGNVPLQFTSDNKASNAVRYFAASHGKVFGTFDVRAHAHGQVNTLTLNRGDGKVVTLSACFIKHDKCVTPKTKLRSYKAIVCPPAVSAKLHIDINCPCGSTSLSGTLTGEPLAPRWSIRFYKATLTDTTSGKSKTVALTNGTPGSLSLPYVDGDHYTLTWASYTKKGGKELKHGTIVSYPLH